MAWHDLDADSINRISAAAKQALVDIVGNASLPAAITGFTRINNHYYACDGRFEIIGLDLTTAGDVNWNLTALFNSIDHIPNSLVAIHLEFLFTIKSTGVINTMNRMAIKAQSFISGNLEENVGLGVMEQVAVLPAGTVIANCQTPPIKFRIDTALLPDKVIITRVLEVQGTQGSIGGVRLHGYWD